MKRNNIEFAIFDSNPSEDLIGLSSTIDGVIDVTGEILLIGSKNKKQILDGIKREYEGELDKVKGSPAYYNIISQIYKTKKIPYQTQALKDALAKAVSFHSSGINMGNIEFACANGQLSITLVEIEEE